MTVREFDFREFEMLCKDICPRCKNNRPLVWDESYKQWIHSWPEPTPGFDKPSVRSAICFATHLRVKYQGMA